MSRKYFIVYAVLVSIVGLAAYIAISFGQVRPFSPPDEAQRIAAIGSLNDLPPKVQQFLKAGTDFLPIPKPHKRDWLDDHNESGQPFDQYMQSNPQKLGGERTIIYLLPIGEFAGNAPDLGELSDYLGAYIGCTVKVMERDDLTGDTITSRTNEHTKNKQLLTRDIEDALIKRLPEDAFALLGVTMTDLYPTDSWNFVFGEARLRDRVGVFSFARYDPAFPKLSGSKVTQEARRLMTLRSYKVMSHEVTHMFGVPHCIYFYCNMNGSNSLDELDRQPLFMCPVELRKLLFATGFDPVRRYEKLKTIFEKNGFEKEVKWIEGRLSRIQKSKAK